MAGRFRQFLGSKPGMAVELVDDSASPFRVRTDDGFEFLVSADDFNTFFKPEESPTPDKWKPFITDGDNQTVDCLLLSEAMDVIRLFEQAFQDYDKARALVRDALAAEGSGSASDLSRLRELLGTYGLENSPVSDSDLKRLCSVPTEVRDLLKSPSFAVFPLPTGSGELVTVPGDVLSLVPHPLEAAAKPRSADPAKPRSAKLKNAEMQVDGNILTLSIDLSKELGPSKSGKTTMVASSEGNKSVPGREEKIGLNVYRQEAKRPATGRKKSFKNVEMDVQGDRLIITADLSLDFGPSRSGKTTIVASTEGNQLVFGRAEKIGLNIYRKLD
jgi:hypothetical protein